MARSGAKTREKIMDSAEALILEQGFAATSVDKIIDRAEITKGSFFYHFDTKAALAQSLVERFAAADLAHLDAKMARAEKLTSDPLQQMLVFVGLFQEEAEGLTEPYPGCLFASYVYEGGLFDDVTHQVIVDTMLEWRRRLGDKFRALAERYPPRVPIDPEALADMLTVVFEGAFIMSKTLKEPGLLAQQTGHYRTYLELLFAPADG
jgi:TetR/AcrR family transcriptional repressor of nem operon